MRPVSRGAVRERARRFRAADRSAKGGGESGVDACEFVQLWLDSWSAGRVMWGTRGGGSPWIRDRPADGISDWGVATGEAPHERETCRMADMEMGPTARHRLPRDGGAECCSRCAAAAARGVKGSRPTCGAGGEGGGAKSEHGTGRVGAARRARRIAGCACERRRASCIRARRNQQHARREQHTRREVAHRHLELRDPIRKAFKRVGV